MVYSYKVSRFSDQNSIVYITCNSFPFSDKIVWLILLISLCQTMFSHLFSANAWKIRNFSEGVEKKTHCAQYVFQRKYPQVKNVTRVDVLFSLSKSLISDDAKFIVIIIT